MADDDDVTTKDPEAVDRGVGGGPAYRSGPLPEPGGVTEPGGLVPPYDGRTGSDPDLKDDLQGTVERQLDETKTGNIGATESPAQESPVSESEVARGSAGSGEQTATDTQATTPHGVGGSITRRGEDISEDDGKEPGREDTGPMGETERPTGKSSMRDSTGIDPQDPDDGPTIPGGYTQ